MELHRDTKNSCKGCGPQYEVTEGQIDRILQAPMFQDKERIVDDATYEARLEKCYSCSELMNQQTCMLCGCFVRVAAKYRDRSCPNVKDRKWIAFSS